MSQASASQLFPQGAASNNVHLWAYEPIHASNEENIYDYSFGHRRRNNAEEEEFDEGDEPDDDDEGTQNVVHYSDGGRVGANHYGHYSEGDPYPDANDYYYDEEVPEDE